MSKSLNLQDLPPDFFVDSASENPAQKISPSTRVSDLPSDFFVDEEPNSSVYLKGSNEIVDMPTSMLGRISNIASGAYDKGNAGAELNSIYFKKFLGDDQPYFDKRISELQDKVGSKIMTQGLMEEIVRATSEQTPQLIEMAKKALTRGTQGGAIGAAGGGAIGSVIPGVGTVSGATIGGTRGFVIGAELGILENSFIQNTGSSYEEYSNYVGKDGKPLGDADSVRLASLISGASSAGLDILPIKAFSKLIPFKSQIMQKLERTGAKALIIPKGKENIAGFVRNLITAQAVEVGTEGAQEGIQAWVGEGLKKYLSDQDIAPAKNGEILSRVGDVMKETALSIIPITATGAVVGKGAEKGISLVKSKKEEKKVEDLSQKISDISKDGNKDTSQEVPISNFTKDEQKVLKDSGLVDDKENISVPTGEQNLANVLSKIQDSRRSTATDSAVQSTQDNFDSTIIEGRLKKLDDNISVIDKQIDVATQLYETKQSNNQATDRIEQKIETLVNKRDSFDEERANILTTQSPRTTEKISVGDKSVGLEVKSSALSLSEDNNITAKGSKIQNLGQQAIRDINKSFREGRSLAKKDVTEAQNFVTNVIDQSALLPADKAKFIRTVKNIKDAETLSKKLPEIQSRISNLVEAASKRKLKSDIKETLSKTKTKKQSGKPVGKFGAENQVTLDRLRKASKLSVEDASSKLDSIKNNSAELAKKGVLPSYEDSLETSVLSSIADSSNTKLSELQSLKDDIDQIITEGRTSRQNTLLAKQAKVYEITSGINQLISEGKNLDLEKDSTFKNFFKGSKGIQAWLNYAWGDIVDSILPPDKNNSSLKTSIVSDLNISKEIQKEKGIQRKRRDAFIDVAKESYGFAKEGELHNKFLADSKEKFLGVFTNSAGKQVRLDYSKSQARKFWMELQDPSLKETIESPEGMGYTPEMISAILSPLDNKDISFARGQLKLYDDFYPEINKVYSRVYGVNLPSIENYSPISRVIDKELDSNVGEFLQETFTRLSVAPGSLKSRVNNLGELRKNSDTEVYQRHIVEMSHFVAMQEKIQQIQSVFGDKEVRKNIEQKAGKKIVNLIDETIDSFVKNGAQKSNEIGKFLNYLNRSFALSVLTGKTVLAAKQMTSTLAYWDGMSAKDFATGIADFAKNPKRAINTLNQSELVKARGVPDYDLAKIGQTNQFKGVAAKNKFVSAMLLPIKFGDKGAILVGGWAYYKNQINQGKTHEQALQAFEEFTAKTQQSTDLDQLTALQRMGAFGKAMTMFMSAPNAYYRAEVRAIRQFKRGEISGKEFGKKLFIYHVLLPATFQFVANGFTLDPEDQLVAVATGPLNGFFILGDVISNLVRDIYTGDSYNQSALNAFKFLSEIKDGISVIATSGGNTSDVLEGIGDVTKGVARVTGLPVDQAKNIAEGIDDFNSGKPIRGTLRFSGYPKKSVAEIDQ